MTGCKWRVGDLRTPDTCGKVSVSPSRWTASEGVRMYGGTLGGSDRRDRDLRTETLGFTLTVDGDDRKRVGER